MIFNGRLNRVVQCGALVLLSSGAFSGSARAVEMTMMLYSLGSGALGAGQTAPDGFYFSTIGVYNQFVYVNPARNAVIVKLSASPNYGRTNDETSYREFETVSLLRAITRAL